jgi:hypothetical protein
MRYSGFPAHLWGYRFWPLLILLALAACAPQAPPPPIPTWPSRVVSQDGLAFWVKGHRLPGTRQEFRVREGGTTQWLSLSLIQTMRFTGPVVEQYRPGEIMLLSGEKLHGEVFVGTLIQGYTELGYWNMPLSRVDRLDMGTE